MIISASRREDMPAFRPQWLIDRLKDGNVTVTNPFNAAQRRQIDLRPEAVDGLVLWSKDPKSLLAPAMQEALSRYAFYVQYTLNGYGGDIEPNLPPLAERLDSYRRLADAYGADAVCWRYDPILIAPGWDHQRHQQQFGDIARALRGYAAQCTISFLDVYRRIQRAMDRLSMRPPDEGQAREIAAGLANIAGECGMALYTCAEAGDYSDLGIRRGACVDAQRLMRLSGRMFASEKDKNQRAHCGCAQSVDIGRYGHCPHGCAYCYASR